VLAIENARAADQFIQPCEKEMGFMTQRTGKRTAGALVFLEVTTQLRRLGCGERAHRGIIAVLMVVLDRLRRRLMS
jgi:hypothetical protein